MNHNEQKAKLLESYTQKHNNNEPKNTFNYLSENGKTYFEHRNAFIQNISLEIAVAVGNSTSKTFGDNVKNYIKSNPTFTTMLTEYFSSAEFKESQEKAEYRRAYTACLNNDIFNKTADILVLGFSTILPDVASTITYAYQQSTHYKEAKANMHLKNGSEGEVRHADFYGRNLFEHPVRKEDTLLNASNKAIPQNCSMFENGNNHTQTQKGKCTIM